MRLSLKPMGSNTSDRANNQPGRLAVVAAIAALVVAIVTPVAATADEAGGETQIEFDLVSVKPDGSVTEVGGALPVGMSDDGRYVLLRTSALTDLVDDDSFPNRELFLRDRVQNTTIRLNATPDGDEAPEGVVSDARAISGDGSVVVFSTAADLVGQGPGTHVYDVTSGKLAFVEELAAEELEVRTLARNISLSFDGRYMAFTSGNPGLVPGDDNGKTDAFVLDRVTGEITLVSKATDGEIANSDTFTTDISADGSRVVFETLATNLTSVSDRDEGRTAFVHDLTTGETDPVSVACDAARCETVRVSSSRISADGTKVLWRTFSPLTYWLTDLETGRLERLDTQLDLGEGTVGVGSLSADARFLSVIYTEDDVAQVYRWDRATGDVVLISRAPNGEPSSTTARATLSSTGVSFLGLTTPGNIFDGPPGVDIVFVATVVGEAVGCLGRPATITGSGVITGTDGDDVIVGSAGQDIIDGGGGDDRICAGGGDDEIVAGTGADRVDGGEGRDRLIGGDGDDLLIGGPGDDVHVGGGGDDEILAGTGADRVDGGDGRDRLVAGDGDDVLNGGPGDDVHVGADGDDLMFQNSGDDVYRGGLGVDTVDYSTAVGPVVVKIDNRAGDGRQAEADNVFASVENVIGSDFGDLIVGSVEANRLDGGPGDDVIRGRAGDDTLIGGPGDDILQGNSGLDLIDAGSGDDRLIGGPNNDTLRAGDGNDYCRGSAGFDTYFNCETADP